MNAIRLVLPLMAWISFLSARADDGIPALGACLEGYEYPHSVDYLTVANQGQTLKMAYMDVHPSKPIGRTIVLLHGKNFNGSYWEGPIAELAEAGYRVIVPDQIGFGKSSKPDSFQYSFQQLAINTRALLDHLGVRTAVLIGHSMGGMLAIRYALMFPDRTDALVLTNPIGLEDWKRFVPYRTIDEWYQSELGQTLENMREYQRTSYFHGDWKPEYEKWIRLAYGWVKSPDYRRIAWNSALTFDMIFTQPVCHEFPDIKVPVLLIIGQLDRTALGKAWAPATVKDQLGNYPELGRRAAAAIPGAKLVPLNGVGHIPHIETPEAFFDALWPFLRGLPTPAP